MGVIGVLGGFVGVKGVEVRELPTLIGEEFEVFGAGVAFDFGIEGVFDAREGPSVTDTSWHFVWHDGRHGESFPFSLPDEEDVVVAWIFIFSSPAVDDLRSVSSTSLESGMSLTAVLTVFSLCW